MYFSSLAKQNQAEVWPRFQSLLKLLFCAKGRVPLPNQVNFWKSSKGGGGVIFNPKIYVAVFGNFKQGFLSMKLMEKE